MYDDRSVRVMEEGNLISQYIQDHDRANYLQQDGA
jgi:hypothetical protein